MGFGVENLTLVHIVISLIAIGSGFVVLGGFLANNALNVANIIFLVMSVATSATGFVFAFERFLPSHILSIISLIVLAVALYAYLVRRLEEPWRRVYIVTAVTALYLNVFVLIVQTFMKNPALAAIAPTQSEPPFAITQGVALLGFVVLGYLSIKRFQTR